MRPQTLEPRPTFADSLQRLRQAQKSSKGAPAYSRYVNRPLGRLIAASLAGTRITPNGVTGISATLTLTAIALIALLPPSLPMALLVAVLLVAGYAFDAADGQLARLRGGGSLAGEWLDHIVDAVKTSTLHAAVLISFFRFGDLAAGWLLVPLGFMAVAAIFFFAVILTDLVRRLHRGSAEMILTRPGRTSTLYSLAVIPADYGFLCVVFVLLWWTPGFLTLYGLLFLANLVILPLSLLRWFRELRRLG